MRTGLDTDKQDQMEIRSGLDTKSIFLSQYPKLDIKEMRRLDTDKLDQMEIRPRLDTRSIFFCNSIQN